MEKISILFLNSTALNTCFWLMPIPEKRKSSVHFDLQFIDQIPIIQISISYLYIIFVVYSLYIIFIPIIQISISYW